MGILPDWMIERDVKIEPFSPAQKRDGLISFGVTSYGYDVRCGYKFKVFQPYGASEIDPKNFDAKALHEVDLTPKDRHNWVDTTSYRTPQSSGFRKSFTCLECKKLALTNNDHPDETFHEKCHQQNFIRIPAYSFVLAETVEEFDIPRDVLCIVLGKSTYARCGVVVNVTPGEPEWKGRWTVEISNTTPVPVRIYAGEGIMQAIFIRTDGHSEAVLNATRRLCGQEQQRMLNQGSPEHDTLTYIEQRLHEDLGHGTCRQSYKDKKGKYQDQTGLTLPTVDGKKPVASRIGTPRYHDEESIHGPSSIPGNQTPPGPDTPPRGIGQAQGGQGGEGVPGRSRPTTQDSGPDSQRVDPRKSFDLRDKTDRV